MLFVVIFWVQNYNKSCTPTIGFEDYFCELKGVKDLLLSNWTIGQLDICDFIFVYGEGEFWTNTIF